MSDSSARFWKSLAIFLLFLLLGVYVLYEWYDDQLYAQLEDKDEVIAQAEQRVKDAESQRLESEEVQAAVRSEIGRLKAEIDVEKERLQAQIAAGEQAQADLRQAMESLEETHAAELAGAQQGMNDVAIERDQLAARLAETEERYQEARTQADVLQADLDKVKQAITDTAAEHQAKIAQLERHLNERVELARTTPLDADLLRTAQEVGVLPVVEAFEQECRTVGDELTESKQALEAMKEDYAGMQQKLAEAQDQLTRLQSELDASRAATAEAQAEDEQAAAQEVEALRNRLTAEAKVREALQRQHGAALEALEETLSDTKAELASTQEALTQARSETQAAEEQTGSELTESQARVRSLEASLDEARAQAEEAQSELREQVAALEQKLADAMAQREESAQAPAAETAPDPALDQAKQRIAALAEELERMREQLAATQAVEQELAQARALSAGFAELKGTYTDRGLLLRLAESELRFQPGQASLPEGELKSLDQIADLLSTQPDLSVRIEGHTDSIGSEALNLELSRKRAQAVRQALIERGVAEGRLAAEGIGAARPIADNAAAEGRSKNRRVEVYILD